MTGNPWRSPISWSVRSCAGVIFRAPEPNLGSTAGSAMTGISARLSGRHTLRPANPAYLGSSG
jgi:hypothetical protein